MAFSTRKIKINLKNDRDENKSPESKSPSEVVIQANNQSTPDTTDWNQYVNKHGNASVKRFYQTIPPKHRKDNELLGLMLREGGYVEDPFVRSLKKG
jgi:hypothetical protein